MKSNAVVWYHDHQRVMLSCDDFQHFTAKKSTRPNVLYIASGAYSLPNCRELFIYRFFFLFSLFFILWLSRIKINVYIYVSELNAPYNFCDEAILVHIRFCIVSFFMKRVKNCIPIFIFFFILDNSRLFTSLTSKRRKK